MLGMREKRETNANFVQVMGIQITIPWAMSFNLEKKVSELYISSPILPDLHKHILCVYTSYSFSSMPILCLSSPSDYEILGGS